MPRQIRDARLETRNARTRLKPQHKPYSKLLEPGVFMLYRRLGNRPGTWSGRRYDGNGKYVTEALRTAEGQLIVADDYAESDGLIVLSFREAQDKIRLWARASLTGSDAAEKPITVGEAIDDYETNLKQRNGDPSNACRVRLHLPVALAEKRVGGLVARDFRPWDEALRKAKLSAASITRTNTPFAAALNLAADRDERIVNHRVWKKALAGIPDSNVARNTYVSPANIHRIVTTAYNENASFGLLVETTAQTGARPAQLRRLDVRDLQDDRDDCRLMMPSSRKGKGVKQIQRKPVPISKDLAMRLRAAARDRADDEPLLVKPSGERWAKSDHTRPFRRAVKRAKEKQQKEALRAGKTVTERHELDPAKITIYALRHASIIRGLLANVPPRVVANNHDTSIRMLEKHYSEYIADHSDTVARAGLLHTKAPHSAVAANVVPLRERH